VIPAASDSHHRALPLPHQRAQCDDLLIPDFSVCRRPAPRIWQAITADDLCGAAVLPLAEQ
jgi:hypothetical protein